MARGIYDHAAKGDPHASRLAAAPHATNLFAVYADNCAPVTGHIRRDIVEGGDCDVDTADLVPLLTMLAPEVGLVWFGLVWFGLVWFGLV